MEQKYAYVNVYEVECNYGGPEEGGWYFDSGILVPDMGEKVPLPEGWEDLDHMEQRAVIMPTLSRWGETCKAMNEGTLPRSSVNGSPDLIARWQDHPGENYPQTEPYYC